MPTLYAAYRDRVLAVTDAGGEWTLRESLEGRRPECMAASPDAPDRAICGTYGDGVWRTTDGGETWDRSADGVGADAVMSAAVSPHDPDVVWAGTEPSAVYRSADGGVTWEHRPGLTDLPSAADWYFPPRPETHHVRWIEPDPNDAGRLYIGIELGALVITPDGGGTWRERPPGSRRDNHQLATHPDAPGRVYSAAGDGYAESTDAGESWSHPQAGLDHQYVWSVAVDPADPDGVVVSAASGPMAAHSTPGESYAYRRDGDRWVPTGDGLPVGEGVTRAVLAPGSAAGELYAANNRGLYRTTDAGRRWRPLDVDWPAALGDRTARGLAVVP